MHQVHDYADESEATDLAHYTRHEDASGLIEIPWAMTFKEFVFGGFAVLGPTSMAAAIGLGPMMQLAALFISVLSWMAWWSERSSMRAVTAQNQWTLETTLEELEDNKNGEEHTQLLSSGTR